MGKQLSSVQIEVLQHMAQGHILLCSRQNTPRLKDMPGKECIHNSVLFALKSWGYIERTDAAAAPQWRRDYAITEAGRRVLADLPP